MASFAVAASLGFEPRQRDPESLVLPLHHEAMSRKNKDRCALPPTCGKAHRSLFLRLIASWCNGSTRDSGSLCLGSNPSEAATAKLAICFGDSAHIRLRGRFVITLFSIRICREDCSSGLFTTLQIFDARAGRSIPKNLGPNRL